MERTIYTIGHSIVPLADFLAALAAHRVAAIADVRRFPTSRRHPHFSGSALAPALASAGIGYAWYEELGGRRASTHASDANAAWKVAAFRAYADHAQGESFDQALTRLERAAEAAPTAVMCAEALWTKCHRRLIADALTARGWSVGHIMGAKRVEPHRLPDFARVRDGRVTYPLPILA